MATLLLSAAGMALGGSLGGSIAGISMAAIGRAAGAMIGRGIDQRLLGGGSEPVETGRIDRFRVTGASEGASIAQVYGRMRVGGHIIWATQFQEHATTSGGGGKGAPSQPSVTQYSYSISIAVAVCEGVITRVGRVWADGQEIATTDLNMRVYKGTHDQLPDPKIVAVQDSANTPAFRGTAYVVFEDLDLSQFGNRVPQFNFEIMRPSPQDEGPIVQDLSHAVTSVAMMPGSGEYTLATTPAVFDDGAGVIKTANVNTAGGEADILLALDALEHELPKCGSTSLVVSWFGDDLRVGECTLKPKVEQGEKDVAEMPWSVSGLARVDAEVVTYLEDRPAYGGTPTDQSVVEAIAALHDAGQDVLFYPFILMDQKEGNGLPDPWSDATDQPDFPWRGRITTAKAPGQPGSTDQTAAAAGEVAAFFGTAGVNDFTQDGDRVSYTGPEEWSYRRFILHNAHLCVAAGGVAAFCIGSEMRSLTQIRGGAGEFVAIPHLIQLAADVRSILGPDTKLSYAADWSEYFGYQPNDGTNDRYFHLDPLWADANIDFIGIDNYMPLSDWRDGCEHLDVGAGAIYNLDYLMGNVEGGEGFDWYYHSPEARAAQIRTPIQDASESEPWAFRYKDIRGWWTNPHYERVGGVRSLNKTAWEPQSKPIWFTEIGCAAIDKGTNQPNKFLDPKSSESSRPRYSDGRRDELMQVQYLRAMYSYWQDVQHNPISVEYGEAMLNMDRAHVWAWDARPFPAFPSLLDVWSDGTNYAKGHWLSGRAAGRPLDSVVREICARSGVHDVDTDALFGYVRGYAVADVGSARAALQPLMLAHGFDAVEREGSLVFKNRRAKTHVPLDVDELVISSETPQAVEYIRNPEAEIADRVRLNYVRADGSFETAASEAIFPEYDTKDISVSEFNMALTPVEAQQITERWLNESRVSRDTAVFSMPPSRTPIGAGDVISLEEPGGRATFRLDQVEVTDQRLVQAVRIEDAVYAPIDMEEVPLSAASVNVPGPVFSLFLDLPLMTGDETPHAPHIASSGDPWPGGAALYRSFTDSDYQLNKTLPFAATLGLTQTPLAWATPGIVDYGTPLEVSLTQGSLSSQQHDAILAGGNLAAIGDGSPGNWELLQFELAQPLGDGNFQIQNRLRGQLGSDALMPSEWPAGSYFVLLNSALKQLDMASSARTILQYMRVGPSNKLYTDSTYQGYSHAFDGNGLRPYAPVSLASTDTGGDKVFNWIRRDRLSSEPWGQFDIPMSEAQELYHIKIFMAGNLLRETTSGQPSWTYTAADMASDGATGGLEIQIAQISDTYGPGLYRHLQFSV